MLQVSRSNNLKIPKEIETVTKAANNVEDTVAIKKGIAMAESKKFNEKKMKEKLELEDKDLKVIEKIQSNSNDGILYLFDNFLDRVVFPEPDGPMI